MHLVDIPTDLLIRLLCHLDPIDVVSCRQVCGLLAGLIENDGALQYRVKLACAGMLDGDREEMPVVDKVDRLQNYTEARPAGASLDGLMGVPDGQGSMDTMNLVQAGCIRVYTAGNSPSRRLVIHRPGNKLMGLPERTITCRELQGLTNLDTPSRSVYAVDLSQDLLVVAVPASIDTRPSIVQFLSISQDCPHPLAVQHDIEVPYFAHQREISLELHEDLVALNVHQPLLMYLGYSNIHDETEMWVINWKTGVMVWRYRSGSGGTCHVLDSSHAIVSTHDGIRIFSLTPLEGTTDSRANRREPVVFLQLPQARLPCTMATTPSYLHRPQLHPDDRPYFHHDPARAVLALRLAFSQPHSVNADAHSTHLEPEPDLYMFFVPLSTLRRHLRGLKHCSERRDIDQGRPRQMTRTLEWAQWGPTGARLARIRMSGGLAWSAVVTACGTRVAIQGDRACQHIWVFDIAPYLDASRGRGDGQEDAKFMAIGNHSCNAEDEKDVPPWSERVRSGYPCRMHLVSVPPSMAAATPAAGILMDDVMQGVYSG
ncbi:hypothetical protein C8Q76DRAFT_862141 [Earliella scabrosa]|nr:hypothetical protein C8Q76DRAFT_862141 [Earliella scabrosa]